MKKIIYMFLLIIFLSYVEVLAYTDGDQPYEGIDSYRFVASDYNSIDIDNLYHISSINLPSTFNLKDYLQTNYQINIPVVNQGSLGICDTFATLKSVETNYALNYHQYLDLSERYLDYMTGNKLYGVRHVGTLGNANDIGDAVGSDNIYQILATFGVPFESDVPYRNYNDQELNILRDAHKVMKVNKSVLFPNVQNSNQTIKNNWLKIMKAHIMQYGSIRANTCTPSGSSYNETTHAFYYHDGTTTCDGSHGISIVGWDDNYSRDNFNKKPTNNGAFIILNSWGTFWGDHGYYYLSYEDDSIYTQLTGTIASSLARSYNQYTDAEKLITSSGYTLNNASDIHKYIGIKFNKQNSKEYLSHLTVAIGNNDYIDKNSKIRFYLNPFDDTFTKEKMVYLKEALPISYGKVTNITLDNPIEIKGTSYAIVMEIITSNNNKIYFYNNIDNQNNTVSGHLYSSNTWNGSWTLTNHEFPVYVFTVNHVIDDVIFINEPTKKVYKKGENLDLSGGSIKITNHDQTIDTLSLTDCNIKIFGYQNNLLGDQTVFLKYEDFILNYQITIENKVKELVWLYKPTKLSYIKGESLDLTGGFIKAIYDDLTEEEIEISNQNVSISGYNKNYLGNQTITLSYAEKNLIYQVNVHNNLLAMAIKKLPNKVSYYLGESLDLTGGIISLSYEDQSNTELAMTNSNISVSGYQNNLVGQQEISISYLGRVVRFNVMVKNNEVFNTLKDNMLLKNNYLYNIAFHTDYRYAFDINNNYTYKLFDQYSHDKSNNYLATGDILKIYANNALYQEYYLSVIADANGDGEITPLDYIRIKNHIMGEYLITDFVNLDAADANRDGEITPLDYIRIKNIIMEGDN